MKNEKPLCLSLADVAKQMIDAAKQAVDKPEDAEFKAFVEKHGKAKAAGILLSGLHNFNERPKS